MSNEQTYWNNTGALQDLSKALQSFIPNEGAVPESRKNKALEAFRQASNAYYDIFNNGGCNKYYLIKKHFGVQMSHYKMGNSYDWNGIHKKTEPAMDKIILAAVAEQKIVWC